MIRLHHVQVAMPAPGLGDDDLAPTRRFYVEGLGLTEVDKPDALTPRGGAWFRAYDASGAVVAEVHVGVEDPFAPARKAHPAFVLDSVNELERAADRLAGLGFRVDWRERHALPPYERFHTRDGHGNRVEVLATG
mgnify:FL=1